VRLVLLAVALGLLATAEPALAQTNDDDQTPLNSRIKRGRQYPTDLRPVVTPADKLSDVQREQGTRMARLFGHCLYVRSRAGALDLLDRTDFGFNDFQQIGLTQAAAAQRYGITDCLRRVATVNDESVVLQWNAALMRQWLLYAVYEERFPQGATWVRPGYAAAPRRYPLSAGNPAIQAMLAFGDCVVAADPARADALVRTVDGSKEEGAAVSALMPALGGCIQAGQSIALSPVPLRAWLREALWHAATDSVPAASPPASSQR
jgi:hypothetical protein